MRRKSKNIMAIILATSMMTGLCSVPVAAAEEIIAEEQAVDLDSVEQEAIPAEEEDTEIEDGEASSENSAGDEDVEIFEEPDSEEDTDEIDVNEEADEEVTAEEAAEDGIAVFSDGSDAQPEAYGVSVAGLEVTSENKDDIFEDGKKAATYNPATNTLTLKDADIIGDIWFATENAVIELVGKNTISEDAAPRAARPGNLPYGDISAVGNLTIRGTGSLETKVNEEEAMFGSYKPFIAASGDVVIEAATLNLTMVDGMWQSGITANHVTLQKKANVTLYLGRSDEEYISMDEESISAISAYSLEINGSILTLPDSGIDKVEKMTVSITNSTVDVRHIRVSDMSVKSSEVAVEAKYAPAISVDFDAEKKLEISDSRVKAAAAENVRSYLGYVIDSYNDIEITNSVVIAGGSEEKSVYSIIAADEDTKKLTITNSWVDCDTDVDADITVKNSVLFTGATGKVTGNAVVPGAAEVVSGKTLNVPESATLTIPSKITVKNNGTINAYCNTIKGTITGTAPVITHGKLTGWLKDSKTHWKECSRCKTKFESAGHSYTAWNVTEKAGLGKSGSKERTCTVCGYVQKEKIAAIKVMTLKVTGGKKSVALKWSKVSGADGYMIYGAKCGRNYRYTLKKTVKKNVTSWTDKKLQAGKYYKYYVVAYKMVNGEKTIIGETGDMHTATLGKGYGYANTITVQKSSLNLKKGKTARIRVALTDTNDKVLQHVARVRYVSTNVKVATVNGKGKVRAVSKGKCYVYCYGMNGLVKKVKVTVK